MQLCAYEESRAEGTISISEAALCQADVAADYAVHPEKRADQPLLASFNCASAKTPLEIAICAHPALGHADIVLSRAYGGILKNVPPKDRATVIQNEKAWLAMVPQKCGFTTAHASDRSINCARNEFELRFTKLDDCLGNSPDDQSNIPSCILDSSNSWTDTPDFGARASFDCEKPSSGVEIAICADSDLGQLDLKLDAIYGDTLNLLPESEHKALDESQHQWHSFVASTCPVGAIGGIPPIISRACIRDLYEKRITQLQSCSRKDRTQAISCLNEFQGLGSDKRDSR